MGKTRIKSGTGTEKKVIEAEVEVVKSKGQKTTAITRQENKEIVFNAENLISQAITAGSDVGTMERLLAMRKTLKEEWAKEQFDIAMANFQGECPVIKKTKAGGTTKLGKVCYYYAPLESIVEQVRPFLTKNGLSYAFQSETLPTGVKVRCIAKHISGHSEPSEVEVPLGTKTDIMSSPQVTASAITFASRYAFKNAFGILTGDDDNDGQVNDLKPGQEEKKDTLNYLDLLKMTLYKKGGKNLTEAVGVFNSITGQTIVADNFPKENNEVAKKMYIELTNSPAFDLTIK